MTHEFQEFYIPERMLEAIDRYVKQGIPPGSFLTAIFSNDLVGAAGKADDENLRNLPAYADYLYNRIPSSCWGSREIVNGWRGYPQKSEKEG